MLSIPKATGQVLSSSCCSAWSHLSWKTQIKKEKRAVKKETTPNKQGTYIFEGIRLSSTGRMIVSIRECVYVEHSTKFPEPMVLYFGTTKRYLLSKHRGSWQYIGDLFQEGENDQ
jgi:hypothetical protein